MSETIKSKIRVLLDIAADDTASEHEIENALNIAGKLLERHHLTEDDLATDPLEQIEDIENAERAIADAFVGSKIYTWEVALKNYLCQLIGGIDSYTERAACDVTTPGGLIKRDGAGKALRGKRCRFFGIAEDVNIAVMLFDELRTAIIALARLKYSSVFRGDGAAYAEGFVQGLEDRRADDQQQQHAQARIAAATNTRGMILIERRNDLIRRKTDLAVQWLASPAGGGVQLRRSSRTGSQGSQSAADVGRSDGRKYDVDSARRMKLN